MMGLFGLSVLLFQSFSIKLVEGASIDVYFKDSASEAEIMAFEKQQQKEGWCLKTRFVSRAQGIKEMGDKEDADLLSYVETTAIPLCVEFYLKAESASSENFAKIARNFEASTLVESVDYPKNIMKSVAKTLHRIQYTLLGLAVLFIIVAIGLINSSTRLSIFANRFIIKSMQLVGATNNFIVKPILVKFVGYAFIAWPIALGLMFGILYAMPLIWPFAPGLDYLKDIVNPLGLAVLALLLLIFGIILSVFGAWLSTRKYLRTKIENLY